MSFCQEEIQHSLLPGGIQYRYSGLFGNQDETKLTFWQKIGKWFREMKSELKKVIWPTKDQLVKNSLVSLGMILISSVVIWSFDEIAQLLVKALLTLAG